MIVGIDINPARQALEEINRGFPLLQRGVAIRAVVPT